MAVKVLHSLRVEIMGSLKVKTVFITSGCWGALLPLLWLGATFDCSCLGWVSSNRKRGGRWCETIHQEGVVTFQSFNCWNIMPCIPCLPHQWFLVQLLYSSSSSVFFPPLLRLLFHWVCIFFSNFFSHRAPFLCFFLVFCLVSKTLPFISLFSVFIAMIWGAVK